MRIGCQTYTWEMLGPSWRGTPEQILDAVAAAGYDGIEFSNAMIGEFGANPDCFRQELARRDLVLAALAYATTGFTDPDRFEDDLTGAQRALEFCSAMGAPLCLGGAAAPSRSDYDRRMAQAVRFYREVAERGRDLGVTVCVHPHSHHGSLLESASEYEALLEATGDSGLMFNPDAGHIVRGGQDLMACLRRHWPRIAHVHIKDVDAGGDWQPLGGGIIPWREMLGVLDEIGYQGWIVAEEESAGAHQDPEGAVRANRAYLRSLGV